MKFHKLVLVCGRGNSGNSAITDALGQADSTSVYYGDFDYLRAENGILDQVIKNNVKLKNIFVLKMFFDVHTNRLREIAGKLLLRKQYKSFNFTSLRLYWHVFLVQILLSFFRDYPSVKLVLLCGFFKRLAMGKTLVLNNPIYYEFPEQYAIFETLPFESIFIFVKREPIDQYLDWKENYAEMSDSSRWFVKDKSKSVIENFLTLQEQIKARQDSMRAICNNVLFCSFESFVTYPSYRDNIFLKVFGSRPHIIDNGRFFPNKSMLNIYSKKTRFDTLEKFSSQDIGRLNELRNES